MNLLDIEDCFDYICPDCKNYVMLEKSEGGKNMLEGTCALCGETFFMVYEEWESFDKKKYINEDEEVKEND